MKLNKGITKKQVLGEFRTGEILAAAKQVIAAKGFAAATMDDIAETAQIAKGTIYLYFKSKNELFQAVTADILAKLISRIGEIKAGSNSAREKVYSILRVMLETLEAEQGFFRVYVSEMPCLQESPPGSSISIPHLDCAFAEIIAAVIEEGIIAGEFVTAPPRLVAYILRGMTKAIALHNIAEHSLTSMLDALPLLTTLVFQGLAVQPGATDFLQDGS